MLKNTVKYVPGSFPEPLNTVKYNKIYHSMLKNTVKYVPGGLPELQNTVKDDKTWPALEREARDKVKRRAYTRCAGRPT